MATSQIELLRSSVVKRKKNSLAINTRRNYSSGKANFLQWLYSMREHYPGLLVPSFLDEAKKATGTTDKVLDQGFLKQFLEELTPQTQLFDPALMTADVVSEFIEGIKLKKKKQNGSDDPSFSTRSNARAAITKLLKTLKISIDPEEMKMHFRGLKRDYAGARQDGQEKVDDGKDPMDVRLYEALADATIRSASQADIAFHAFLLMDWSLMSRSANVSSLHLRHLDIFQDCLRVFIPVSKTDQEGDNRNARHVFANPFNPSVCPVTALGVYFLTHAPTALTDLVFDGSKQSARFSARLRTWLKKQDSAVYKLWMRLGCPDIGLHSLRKGARTYCTNGTTASPQEISVLLRGGWSIGGVQARYLFTDPPMDCFIGRILSLLDILDESFATSPPEFADLTSPTIKQLLDICFPSAPVQMQPVLLLCVASVVYHSDWLQKELPANHPLLSSPLFTNPDLLASLRQLVSCKLPEANSALRPTGIPPHTMVLLKQARLERIVQQQAELHAKQLTEIQHRLEAIPRETAQQTGEAVSAIVERNGITAQHVSPQQLTMQLSEMQQQIQQNTQQMMTSMGLPALVQFVQQVQAHPQESFQRVNAALSAAAPPPLAPAARPPQLPADFDFPSGGANVAFNYWMLGNPTKDIPPLRSLRPDDMPVGPTHKRLRTRFSDLKNLCERIEERVRQTAKWKEHPTAADVAEMFQEAKSVVTLPPQTAKGNLRRKRDPDWNYVINELRALESQNQQQPAQVAPHGPANVSADVSAVVAVNMDMD